MEAVAPGEHARLIAELGAALQGAGLGEDRVLLDARLEQVQAALDRIEARLAEVERELASLRAPGLPF